MTSSPWQPYREPLRVTLTRTISIALIASLLVIRPLGGGVVGWLIGVLLMLWPSFGGHWVDLWFLNWLRPRISAARAAQVAARLAVWFVGGIGLALGMCLTAMVLIHFQPARWPPLWLGGLAFIGIELVAQLVLHLRGRPSFFNGRG